MADSKQGLKKPVFTKVEQLKPGTRGHTIIVKVVNVKTIDQNDRPEGLQLRHMRMADCLVGDETGTIIFTAKQEQVDLMTEGSTIIVRNAKIDLVKETMRLGVDVWGCIELAKPAAFTVKEDNNLSLIEYEVVNAVE